MLCCSLGHLVVAHIEAGVLRFGSHSCTPTQVLLSMLLSLPAPKHQVMYYECVIVDLCKLLSPFPLALEQAVNELYVRLPRMDVHLAERVVTFLSWSAPLPHPTAGSATTLSTGTQ